MLFFLPILVYDKQPNIGLRAIDVRTSHNVCGE